LFAASEAGMSSTASDAAAYVAHRDAAARRMRRISSETRDIGPIPDVANPLRRAAAAASLRVFLETYMSGVFSLAWSDDHLRVIDAVERSVRRGGLYAIAMPRGSGKTSICEGGALWALLNGLSRYAMVIASDQGKAAAILQSLQTELEYNEQLGDDYPEVCYPISQLEGVRQRAAGQLSEGEPTLLTFKADRLVFPTISSSSVSGAIVQVAGMGSAIRGARHKLADGTAVRPDLVLADDPQTDESAHSEAQCYTRERTIATAVLGLAGPGKKIAGLMALTVIRKGDLAERLLDSERHPEWSAERTKMLYEFPTDTGSWDDYANIYRRCLTERNGDISEATAFYAERREAMDAGARVAWEARKNDDELSALQHAMNLYYRDRYAFAAEFQNEPEDDSQTAEHELDADSIVRRLNGRKRGTVPSDLEHLVMFADVQGKALYWMLCAFADDMTGAVVDYGTEPEQRLAFFTLRQIRDSLQNRAKGAGLEGAIYAGLERLAERTIGRRWRRDDGAELEVSRCLIDAGWGASTDTVYEWAAATPYRSVVTPWHGRFVGANGRSMAEWDRRPGERVGDGWRLPALKGKRRVRHVLGDVNHWKSFAASRLSTPVGQRGAITLPGNDGHEHRMLAEHLTAEQPVRVESKSGATVDEWRAIKNRDNHLWDCLVGCYVAASMQGCKLAQSGVAVTAGARRTSVRELMRRNRGR
jgi:hypothetical protein